jgi:uracil-DNA glycosylase
MNNLIKLNAIEKEAMEDLTLPLRETAKNLVFGKGNSEAKIIFVGEAPGKNEDEQGFPFVGAAGKNLDSLLQKAGLSINDAYICNILKYRPPNNRDPTIEEIKKHVPYLLKQINTVNPTIICSLGNYATKFFLSKSNPDNMNSQPGITQIHGKIHNIEINGLNIKLIPLFHPAAIIYNQSLKTEWEKDIQIVKGELNQSSLF